jgi:hypothetical protein
MCGEVREGPHGPLDFRYMFREAVDWFLGYLTTLFRLSAFYSVEWDGKVIVKLSKQTTFMREGIQEYAGTESLVSVLIKPNVCRNSWCLTYWILLC